MLREILRFRRQVQPQSQETREKLPRLFLLFPVPSLKWRFITIDPKNLPLLSGLKSKSTYLENLDLFNTVFDLKRLKIDRLSTYIKKTVYWL
ncbi:hypothetical protein BDF14DRAFT_1812125 [Spinellus fusiger]|nr:hypothetical protein BDF14DRAFT_1812125 [Spinellus fusiger]